MPMDLTPLDKVSTADIHQNFSQELAELNEPYAVPRILSNILRTCKVLVSSLLRESVGRPKIRASRLTSGE